MSIEIEEDQYEYTVSNSVFNVMNQSSVNYIDNPNSNFTVNISSKENDAILLSESYFVVNYEVTAPAATTVTLIPNWFLSMISSFNLAINSFSLQLNSIYQGRTIPMLAQTLRYLQSEASDFNKYASIQREIYQQSYITDAGVQTYNKTYYPLELLTGAAAAVRTRQNYYVFQLKDIFPSAGAFNQVSGLLTMSMVLSFNRFIQALGSAISALTIKSINFHYPVRTFNLKQSIDIDLNYISTFGILNGTVPQIFDLQVPINSSINSVMKPVVMSNIQLSVNKVYKLIILPVFTLAAGTAAGNLVLNQKNQSTTIAATIAVADVMTEQTQVMTTYQGLGTLPGSVGSRLFGYKNVKVVVNGNRIEPTNIVQNYEASYYADWYNYNFSFNGNPINKLKKPDLAFDSDMYTAYKPIIVDLGNATSNNSFNSISFSFDVYNLFVPAAAVNYNLRVDYIILNEIVLTDN